MKKINKIFAVVLLLTGMVFTSCETAELDLLDDPNNLTLDKALLDRYLNAIELSFNNFMSNTNSRGAQVTRVNYMFGTQYEANYGAANQNTIWAQAYQQMFSDMAAAEPQAIALENNKHLGVMRILKAYTLITLVDMFGDVPNSQATQPIEFPAPVADPGADVYAAAIAMLDEGIAFLNQPGDALENDFFYDNDYSKWTKLANTVKMVAYLNSGNTSGFNSIANNAGSYISSAADDFQFQYGSNETNPDTRHPSYGGSYQPSGGVSGYRANWLMGTMLADNDPRIRYYFYRQNQCTPGAPCGPGNQTTLGCSVGSRPAHFPASMIFCSLEDGYWGRDHGNSEGIPPDGNLKTAMGVYPAGGRFDGDEFTTTQIGDGAGGAGINPIMLSSYTALMRAEVLLAANNVSGARTALRAGVEASLAKVTSFGSLDPDANSDFFPSSADQTAFLNTVANDFTAASTSGKWNLIAEQVLIANFGAGMTGYNMYRRTGFPTDLQFNIEPSPGPFIRSFLYPANEANVNANLTQKSTVAVQVFWDTNASSPGFPPAN